LSASSLISECAYQRVRLSASVLSTWQPLGSSVSVAISLVAGLSEDVVGDLLSVGDWGFGSVPNPSTKGPPLDDFWDGKILFGPTLFPFDFLFWVEVRKMAWLLDSRDNVPGSESYRWSLKKYWSIYGICWSSLDYFGILLIIVDYFWIFWNIVEYFWIFWNILTYFWIFWNIFEYFEIFLNILKYFWIFWNIFWIFWNIFWIIWIIFNMLETWSSLESAKKEC
jgi:hypothetical protein